MSNITFAILPFSYQNTLTINIAILSTLVSTPLDKTSDML